MNPEVRTAKNWYWWLWLSPLITIPSVIFILILSIPFLFNGPGFELAYLWTGLVAILGPALWHLFLLIPALNQRSEFVRWHGRQALLLTGVRTAVPAVFLIYSFATDGLGGLWSIPILIAVWLFGTLWGQGQAASGDCALMRWTGHGAGLPLPTRTAKPVSEPSPGPLIDETWNHRTAYYEGVMLRERGKPAEAVRVFQTLLVSDATPELKAKVVTALNEIVVTDENLKADVLVAIFRFSHEPEQRRMALARLERMGLVEPLL